MRKSRKNYTPVEKVAILRRHLIDRVSISDLCDEYQLSPTLFYAWQKLFFENAPLLSEPQERLADQSHVRTIAALRDKPAAQERGRRGIDGRTYSTKKELGDL